MKVLTLMFTAAAACLLLTSSALAGGPTKSSLNASLTADDPCSQSSGVIVHGAADFAVTTDAASSQLTIKVTYRGDGNNNNSLPYKVSFMANATFAGGASSYSVPFSAVLTARAKLPDIAVSGVVNVTLDSSGVATAVEMVSGSASCTQ